MTKLNKHKIPTNNKPDNRERAYLLGVTFPDDDTDAEERFHELRRLAETAGAQVVGEMLQKRLAPDKRYFIGKGKAMEAAEEALLMEADLLIIDNDLSPAQARNLEELTEIRVVERSQLIMDIFATGAKTLQARKQVELAQMQYFLPRLKRLWSHLSRIRASIGMRGPGETQLEVDRRIIRKKIADLKGELKGFENRKRLEIDSRRGLFKVCLVGYTNTGKSTLLNLLTGSDIIAKDSLFCTLDTRTKKWKLDGNLKVLLSDTVGFIRNLPHHLVASFHATLEEAATADLLLHVVDASHAAAFKQIEAASKVLKDLGADRIPKIMVFNKIDNVQDFMEVSHLEQHYQTHVLTSAKENTGIKELTEQVQKQLVSTFAEVEVDMPASSGKLQAFLTRKGDVIVSKYCDGRHYMTVRIPPFELGELKSLVKAQKAELKVTLSEPASL